MTTAATTESHAVRRLLIGLALVSMALLLIVPLVLVFVEALRFGWDTYFSELGERSTRSAIHLTLLTVAIAVPVNTFFGVVAAWCITKYDFKAKALLTSLIDLPFAISPVIAGLMIVMLFSSAGWFGPVLNSVGIQILFAPPAIILATMFVTFPFVARELIPLMQSQGRDEELAALTLGARGWQIFTRVTLPNIKWGLLYGVILCNARAMGEFGAVAVVAGKIQGKTNTMPLQIEMEYLGNNVVAAFAISSILALLAIVTLVIKTSLESRTERRGGHH
jgi:sulfate/thiosulfate transport system permease protein